jgi:hypothetical protein
MKNMRELINLMEGVMAVPGLNEKSTSEKQARFMAAAAHDSDFAKKVGIDQDVAKEFNKADTGTKQLSNAMKEGTESDMQTAATAADNEADANFDSSQEMATESVPAVDSCQQSNPANADVACAMEGEMEQSLAVTQALKAFESAVMGYGMEPDEAFDRISQQLGDEDLAAFRSALEAQGQLDAEAADEVDFEPMGSLDMSDDAEALASAGRGSDEDYGYTGEFDEAFDIQNGYDDVHVADGNDYFPNGADGPVVKAVGPSGARQGDNPEQKKMQIAEVHKELVYSYRSFLGESAKPKKKVN